jgi:hypothetical protein
MPANEGDGVQAAIANDKHQLTKAAPERNEQGRQEQHLGRDWNEAF